MILINKTIPNTASNTMENAITIIEIILSPAISIVIKQTVPIQE